MTEKSIFADKLSLSLNISDFNSFFMWKLQPPWKSPPFSQQTPSKSWGPSKSPLFENLVGGATTPPPPPALLQKGGAHYAWRITRWLPKFVIHICLRPETTYDGNIKLTPETKYHNENKIAPKMVGNFVANMYWIIFLALPGLRPTVAYLDPYGAKLLDYGPS